MANQQAKKTRSTKARAGGSSRSHAGHPGQQARGRENGARRNPDAAPARPGGNKPSAARRNAGRETTPSRAPSPAQPLGMMDRVTNTVGLAGVRAAKGVRAAGTKAAEGLTTAGSMAAESVKEHPTAVATLGASLAAAGVALLAARALLGSSEGADDEDGGPGILERAGEALGSLKGRMGGAMDSLREGTSRLGEYGRDGLSKVGTGLRGGASAVGSGAERGYEYTKDMMGNLWEEHPLATGAGILALGVIAGMMIPTTRLEQSLFGQTAGRLTRRAQSAGRELLKQGRQVAESVVSGTGEAVREMADLDALAPDRVTRKVKRFTNRLKDAVTDAMQD